MQGREAEGSRIARRSDVAVTWRRNGERELTGRTNARGQPERAFISRSWTIDVPLDKQRP